MQNKKRLFIIIAILFIIFIKIYNLPEFKGVTDMPLSNRFVGTYVWDVNNSCYITVAPSENNTFYYYNCNRNVYLKGVFEKIKDNEYSLSGNNVDNQTITCVDLGFSFVNGDINMTFKKISEIPIFPPDIRELAE